MRRLPRWCWFARPMRSAGGHRWTDAPPGCSPRTIWTRASPFPPGITPSCFPTSTPPSVRDWWAQAWSSWSCWGWPSGPTVGSGQHRCREVVGGARDEAQLRRHVGDARQRRVVRVHVPRVVVRHGDRVAIDEVRTGDGRADDPEHDRAAGLVLGTAAKGGPLRVGGGGGAVELTRLVQGPVPPRRRRRHRQVSETRVPAGARPHGGGARESQPRIRLPTLEV